MKHYLKKNINILLLPCILGCLAQITYVIIQFLMAQSFTSAFNFDLKTFIYWTGLMVLCYVVYLLISAIEIKLQAKAKMKLNNQIRHDILVSTIQKNKVDYQKKEDGEYVAQLTTNIKQINALAWAPFFDIIDQICMIISCAISLFLLNWVLLIVGIISSIILLLLPKLFTSKMEKLGQLCSEADGKGLSQFKEIFAGIDVFKSFNKKNLFIQKGDQYSNTIEQPNYKRESVQGYITCGTGMISILMQIIQQIITVLLAIQGKVMIGAFASASNLAAGIANGFSGITNDRMALASAKSYFETIETQKEEYKSTTASFDSISIRDLSFQYPDKPEIKYPDITFQKGKKYAILGPSGCGKSTLLKLLLGWYSDYQGDIELGNKNIKEFSEEEISENISYIDQNVFIFNDTILNNITLTDDFSKEEIDKALQDSALLNDMDHFPDGLQTMAGENGNQLSGGQKQRIAIARALLHKHNILFVDEGTSALDQKNANIVEECLLKNPNLTLLLVSHHLTDDKLKSFDQIYSLS